MANGGGYGPLFLQHRRKAMNAPTPTNYFGTSTFTFDWHNMDAMSQLKVSEAVTRILAEHGI